MGRIIKNGIEYSYGGSGSQSGIIISSTEQKIGTYFGQDLYQISVIVPETMSGYTSLSMGVEASMCWLDLSNSFIWNNNHNYNVPIIPYKNNQYNEPCMALAHVTGGYANVDYSCIATYVGCEAMFTIKYIKNPITN